ncbi:MAG: DUF6265 family protein [Bacteroidia bacterium]
MWRKFTGLIVLNCCIFFNIQAQDIIPPKLLHLQGTWMMAVNDKNIFQQWKKENGNTLSGISFTISDKNDTTLLTIFTIVAEPGGVYYIPILKSANNTIPSKYKLMNKSDSIFIFISNEIEFPQRITYEFNDEALSINEQGTFKGENKSVALIYKKIKK